MKRSVPDVQEQRANWNGRSADAQAQYLRISGIPVNRLAGEVIVLRLEFDDAGMEEILRQLAEQ